MNEVIQAKGPQELMANELLRLLNVSEIIEMQVTFFGELRALALAVEQQQGMADLNPELFEDIHEKLEQLRNLWKSRYQLVSKSINDGNLEWSKVGKISPDDFWFSLLVGGEPAIRYSRFDIYDGDADVLNLSISGLGGGAASFPELFYHNSKGYQIRHRFYTANTNGPHAQHITLEFEETIGSPGEPRNSIHALDKIFVEGIKELTPALGFKSFEAHYSPKISESFKLSADRNPISTSLARLPF